MSSSCKCTGVNGEALQVHAVDKIPYLYYKSCENPYQVPYQVLQVMCAMPEWAIKLKVVVICRVWDESRPKTIGENTCVDAFVSSQGCLLMAPFCSLKFCILQFMHLTYFYFWNDPAH